MSAVDKDTLSSRQLAYLRMLADRPSAYVPPAILRKLRRLGLAGKAVGRDDDGRQKTTSPVTEAGALLVLASRRNVEVLP